MRTTVLSPAISCRFRRALLPTVSKRVPEGPQWIHEIKHDGYRMIVRRNGDRVRLFTRREDQS
jgi:ATP-dependent DNA ligase